MDEIKKIKVNTKTAHRRRGSVEQKYIYDYKKEKETTTITKQNSPNNNYAKMKSNQQIIDFREMIPRLLNKINTTNSPKNNTFLDNISYSNNSNSSEILMTVMKVP